MITVPNTETIGTPYEATLDPQGTCVCAKTTGVRSVYASVSGDPALHFLLTADAGTGSLPVPGRYAPTAWRLIHWGYIGRGQNSLKGDHIS